MYAIRSYYATELPAHRETTYKRLCALSQSFFCFFYPKTISGKRILNLNGFISARTDGNQHHRAARDLFKFFEIILGLNRHGGETGGCRQRAVPAVEFFVNP